MAAKTININETMRFISINIVVLIILQVIDVGISYYAISNKLAIEGNPLMMTIVQPGDYNIMVLVKLASVLVVFAVFYFGIRLASKFNPDTPIILCGFSVFINVAMVCLLTANFYITLT